MDGRHPHAPAVLRRRGVRWGAAAVVTAMVAVGTFRAATNRTHPRPQAPAPASVVMAASGPAGVIQVRDGTVIRMDQQSPPGRLVIPPPPTGPRPDGVAVGRHRVWVSSEGLVRGYGPGGGTIRVFRIAPSGTLRMAEGGGTLWAGVADSDVLRARTLADRRLRFRLTLLPGALVGVSAIGRDAWAVVKTAGDATLVVRARPGARRATTVTRLSGVPRGIAAGVRTVWVLTDRQLLAVDTRTGSRRGPFPVPLNAREVAAGPGRALVSDPLEGIVRERTLGGRFVDHPVGRGARGLTAAADRFWVSVGPQATPVSETYAPART